MQQNIVIMCAMQEEMDSILNTLGVTGGSVTLGNFNYITAILQQKKLIFCLCGVGKVNAAIHTQHAISSFAPIAVINVGVAGGLSPELNFGDVVIATDVVHHDFDVTAFGLPRGQILFMDTFAFTCAQSLIEIINGMTHPEYKIATGRIITGDQFIDSEIQAQQLYQEFNALACDMEGAAVAQTCYINKTSFLVVRALSDMAGQKDKAAKHSFEQLKNTVADRSSAIVKHILDKVCPT